MKIIPFYFEYNLTQFVLNALILYQKLQKEHLATVLRCSLSITGDHFVSCHLSYSVNFGSNIIDWRLLVKLQYLPNMSFRINSVCNMLHTFTLTSSARLSSNDPFPLATTLLHTHTSIMRPLDWTTSTFSLIYSEDDDCNIFWNDAAPSVPQKLKLHNVQYNTDLERELWLVYIGMSQNRYLYSSQ